VFLRTIPYNFYALGTLVFLYTIITGGKDYGPMKKHEENTMKTGDLWNDPGRRADEKETDGQLGSGRVSDLVIPVASLIICCIIGMLYTGGFFEGEGFVDAFANSDAARGFVMGSLISIIITFFLYMWRGTVSFEEFMKSIPEGWGTMVGPMVILVMAWTLSGMT
jgi:Na+/H+ antiporter NhaC